MYRIAYQCTLLTDLVITSNPATEGFHRSLNYIPGSKFLGIVASQLYDMDDALQTRAIFHRGDVRFGDAHPFIANQRLHKIPLAWKFDKDVERDAPREIYLHYFDSAPEQEREAYFTTNYQWYEVIEDFSIKSAYDSQKYRAQDQQMYGYFSLPRGSEWQFYIDYDSIEYMEIVEEALVGERRIGRSKSAEYGLVDIKRSDENTTKPSTESIPKDSLVLLYAASNWCFYDQYGECTLQPTPEQLGLPNGSSIDWGASQIRTRHYRTWNRKRNNRDADRLIIEKGAVVVATISQDFNPEKLAYGIGAHRSEGLGQVLANPDFLPTHPQQRNRVLTKYESSNAPAVVASKFLYQAEQAENNLLTSFLTEKSKYQTAERLLDEKVNQFIEDHADLYDGISNSQWGQVRKYTRLAGTSSLNLEKLLFGDPKNEKEQGFLLNGQAAKEWRTQNRAGHLQSVLFPTTDPKLNDGDIILFTQKLAAEMAKLG